MENRQLKINLEKLQDYLPSIIIKDPSFCFEGISTKEEMNFILSLSTEQWETIGDLLYEEYFDEITQFIKDFILEQFTQEFKLFQKQKLSQ
jgi:hypothetical protein